MIAELARDLARSKLAYPRIQKIIEKASKKGEPGVWVSKSSVTIPVRSLLLDDGYEVSTVKSSVWIWWGN